MKHSESLWMILKHDYIILEELICILNVREKVRTYCRRAFRSKCRICNKLDEGNFGGEF